MAFTATAKNDVTKGTIVSTLTYGTSAATSDGTITGLRVQVKDSSSTDYIIDISASSSDNLINGLSKIYEFPIHSIKPPLSIKWTISMIDPRGTSRSNTITCELKECVQPQLILVGSDNSYACYMDALIEPKRNAMVSVHNTLQSKYPFVVYNSLNLYDAGNATGFWAEWDDGLQDFDFDAVSNANFRNTIKDFLYDFKPKLLCYRDGRKWLVSISGSTISEIRQSSDEHVKLSFDWTEIDDTSDDNLSSYGIQLKGVIK